MELNDIKDEINHKQKYIEDINKKLEETNKKLVDEEHKSKRRKETNNKIKLIDIENAKTTESISNYIEKYYSSNANKKFFITQSNKMIEKLKEKYEKNNTSKYKFNTLLKYLSKEFGVNHLKNDNQLVENLSRKMIIMHELERHVPLPTFDKLIEKIKQNEKSRRIRKIKRKI